MRVQITDEQTLASIVPRNIRVYLRMHGWEERRIADVRGREQSVWSLPSDAGVYEVLSPSSRAARDFPERVAELLRTLSIAEDRSELELARDLATLAFDIQYFHTQHAGPSGTAPLRDASDAFRAAHNVLSSAAATLDEPRLVLPSRRSPRTNEFMDKVLAGPTSEGSYVISIWVPIPPRLTPDEDAILFDIADEPFERVATRHLNRALAAAQSAAREVVESDVGLDAFVNRAAEGLSANLCEALAEMAGEDSMSFDVRFSWALDRPVRGLASALAFHADTVPVLREAARELRALVPEEAVRIRGNVVRLHREGVLGPGDVTIAGLIVDDPLEKLRRVSVNLSEPDYQLAINAHETFAEVEISGSLLQRGTRSYLRDTRGLDVLPLSPTES